MVLPNDVMTVISLMSTGILRPFSVLINLISALQALQRFIVCLRWDMGQAVKPAPYELDTRLGRLAVKMDFNWRCVVNDK